MTNLTASNDRARTLKTGAGALDLARFRLTRLRVAFASAVMLLLGVGVVAVKFSQADHYVLRGGGAIGGDFVAFFAAAKAASAGHAPATYDPDRFAAMIRDYGPTQAPLALTWQYPPSYALLILPFATLGYLPAYLLWTGGTLAVFLATMRAAKLPSLFLFVIIASPAAFHAATTGQNGFLTAALLTLAALDPKNRPIAAGAAAALLTVKPHLGLLIPVAYAAGGCWRAFIAASIGAAALAGASALVFGIGAWTAFFDGAANASALLAEGLMPLFKMTTPYAAALYAGAPPAIALEAAAVVALAAALAVALVWRRVDDPELRAAALTAGVFLAAPYGFYYELIILALPAAILARRALQTGWLRFEQAGLLLVVSLPLFLPGAAARHGFSLGLVVVLLLAALVVRRIAHERPGAFGLGSASLLSVPTKLAIPIKPGAASAAKAQVGIPDKPRT